ncbi:MAG: DUF1761 domain-containing protein [Gemmatimonadales bacterium]
MDNPSAMAGINWLAVIVAAVATFILGGLWYGPLFGKAWMAASGVTEERARQGNPAVIFGLSFVLQLVAAIVLAMFIGPEADLTFSLLAGLSVGAFWVATAFGVVYLFERRPLGHWVVNALYQIVAFTLMGGILGVWK